MQLAVFILVYPLLWLISRLPFRVLYLLSDGVYQLLYHVVGYRKKVVRDNLELVFPEKSSSERLEIEKKFFKHLCDMFLEMIKTLGITDAQIQKRYYFTNIEEALDLEHQKKSIIVMMPHYASWEWVFSLNKHVTSEGYAIYQRVQNKYFDKLVRDIRSKYGTTLIPTFDSRKIISNLTKNGTLFTVGIVSDQSPMHFKAKHWTKFMGITVPVHVGGEELCKKHNLTPLYLKVKKVGRGYYQATFKPLVENVEKSVSYEITEAFLKETEKSILEAPEFYFWTHKRWKHRDKVPKEYLTANAITSQKDV
ncbi:lysophospholipid acyltransferase family protein [Flagellimonas eckloniae]|uniref:Lipid A biosynthesis acyltransferase n=1 Tax=Flagellimonas eckloniae TaxID=346185 RepID=A0A0Q0XJN9_9FLAO|nr:lysophospholipid acyltransferase family protein [Allomuricauda eckloniae]KQC29029.1 lipid A biosynthesis acyltransferase [Allomuricauda eckloniae]